MLDAGTGLLLHTTRVGGLSFFNSVAITVAADRVLVGSGATITVLDAHSGALLRTVTVNGDIRHMAVDSRTGQIFIVGPGGLGVLDPRRGWAMRTLAVGGNLSAVAVDAGRGRVYVANAGATDRAGTLTGTGTVSIIDAASGAVLRTVPVGVAPSALAVDMRTGRAIVVNAGGRVLLPTAWSFLPDWLSRLLPFLPRPDSGPPSVHGSVSVLDAPPSRSSQ
jgi:YVTN family beta-propeller protein